jgi:hypothetical protein
LQVSNPNIFAILSKASPLFKDKELDLKEGMVLGDYKELTKLRLKNYLVIMRMLTRVDPSLYNQVKTKIYQVKALAEFLSVDIE